MAITRPPVLPAWAEAGDKVQPSNAEIAVGWPLSNTPPSRQRFNWVLNYLANAVQYLTKRGFAEWDAGETYDLNDTVIGPDGEVYRSTANSNKGNNPTTATGSWALWSSNNALYLATTLRALCDSNRIILQNHYL